MDGAELIAQERRRHPSLGYTAEHDAHHDRYELPWAARAYLWASQRISEGKSVSSSIHPEYWPFPGEWDPPTTLFAISSRRDR